MWIDAGLKLMQVANTLSMGNLIKYLNPQQIFTARR